MQFKDIKNLLKLLKAAEMTSGLIKRAFCANHLVIYPTFNLEMFSTIMIKWRQVALLHTQHVNVCNVVCVCALAAQIINREPSAFFCDLVNSVRFIYLFM